jgi:exosortase
VVAVEDSNARRERIFSFWTVVKSTDMNQDGTTETPALPDSKSTTRRRLQIAGTVFFLACIVWALWLSIDEMADNWATNPTYSHGYLVPLISAALLWMRRGEFPQKKANKSSSWGLALVLFGAACHVGGLLFYIRWLTGFALIPYIAGAVVLLWGWAVLKWALPAIGFLVFMIPLPYSVERFMQEPLKRVSTNLSAYMLQTLGFPALTEGTIIIMDTNELGVVDACSGLKMLMIFFAMSTAVALFIRRPLIEKLIVVLSALPIAIAVNVVRITTTGICYGFNMNHLADLIFHDLAGWLMMPQALLLLWLLLRILSFVIEDTDSLAARPAMILNTGTTRSLPAQAATRSLPPASKRRGKR